MRYQGASLPHVSCSPRFTIPKCITIVCSNEKTTLFSCHLLSSMFQDNFFVSNNYRLSLPPHLLSIHLDYTHTSKKSTRTFPYRRKNLQLNFSLNYVQTMKKNFKKRHNKDEFTALIQGCSRVCIYYSLGHYLFNSLFTSNPDYLTLVCSILR